MPFHDGSGTCKMEDRLPTVVVMKPFLNTRLYLRDGEHLDVYNLVEDAARMLRGQKDGDDAYDMGYAALQNSDGVQKIRPEDVVALGPVTAEP